MEGWIGSMTPIYETHQIRLSMNILCKMFSLSFAFLLFIGCDKIYRHGYIVFNNNSNIDVTCLVPTEGAIGEPLIDLDSEDNDVINWDIPLSPYDGAFPVSANSSRKIASDGLKNNWVRMFWNDTLYVEIYRGGNLIYNYTNREILDNKLTLQVYKITYEQFESQLLDGDTFYISYPPTPEMKDIKMWPPYEEAIKVSQWETL